MIAGVLLIAGVLAASAWWVFFKSSQDATGQEFVEIACDKAEVTEYFDMVVTGNYPARQEWQGEGLGPRVIWERKISVAGNDVRSEHRVVSKPEDTEFLGGLKEEVYVGGKLYRLFEDGSGRTKWELVPHAYPAESITSIYTGTGDWQNADVLCPSFDKIQKLGAETLDGVSTTRYQYGSTFEQRYGFPGAPLIVWDETYNYWVDETGVIVQIKKVADYRANDREEFGDGAVYTTVTKISGIGEPNTITAPVVP